MLNHGKTNEGTKINVSGKVYIMIYPNTIFSALIRVYHEELGVLWQKDNCTCNDIHFAIEIAKRELQTGVFECPPLETISR